MFGLAARGAKVALFAFRGWTSRIHSPWFWRAFYAGLASDAGVTALALACRVTSSASGLDSEQVALRLSHLFLTGWPHHPGTRWVNLDVLRCHWRVQRNLRQTRATMKRPLRPEGGALRVGVLANLGGSLIFPRALFERCPPGIELCAIDLNASDADSGAYLKSLVPHYVRVDPGNAAKVAEAIEESELDVLLVDVYKADVDGVLDRVSTPCVVNLSTTVLLRFHPSIDFHLYFLQQADYVIRENRMFCGTSRSWFSHQLVFSGFQPFDSRDIDPDQRRRWSERDPLLVYHGKLYKLSDEYLDCVLGILAEDANLEFVVVGRDDGGELDRIRDHARAFRVESRVHYEGDFRPVRNSEGVLDHPSWLRLVAHLGKARLAPDPWPLPGGCSRLEAYAAGAPVAHMGIRSDPSSWSRPQHAVTADQPALAVPGGTAYSLHEYRDLCHRILYDAEFADSLAAEQAALSMRLTNPTAFWEQFLKSYREWLRVAPSPVG